MGLVRLCNIRLLICSCESDCVRIVGLKFVVMRLSRVVKLVIFSVMLGWKLVFLYSVKKCLLKFVLLVVL